MLKVSPSLYDAFQLEDFYTFVFAFLIEHAKAPPLQAALQDKASCRMVWDGLFDPDLDKLELALRHAYVLGARVKGEDGDGASIGTMQMKANLDNWGYIAFSAFDWDLD